ncbi:MAG: cell division protein ZapA [Alphaproteobacteria bacterium]|nr:cell division protein ZapA [Alphaproteobacteria bacterium]
MAQVTITIDRREYAIACENGEELQIIKLGRMLDEKAKALTGALGHINETQLLAMVGLLIADELVEAKKNVAQNPTPAINSNIATQNISDVELSNIDETFSSSIKTLSNAIKSIASDLKSL